MRSSVSAFGRLIFKVRRSRRSVDRVVRPRSGSCRRSRTARRPHNRRVNVPCPTHSGRRAHKSCHFCRKAICRLCEVRMRGHLYCSERCARDAGRHAVWRRVAGRPGDARPGPPGGRRGGAGGRRARPAGPAHRAGARRSQRALRRWRGPAAKPPRPGSRPSSAVGSAFRLEGTRLRRNRGLPVRGLAAARLRRRSRTGDSASTASASRGPSASARCRCPRRSPTRRRPPPAPDRRARSASPRPRVVAPTRLVAVAAASLPRRPRGPTRRASRAAPAPVLVPRGPSPPDLTRGPDDRPDVLVSFDAGSSDRGATADPRRAVRPRDPHDDLPHRRIHPALSGHRAPHRRGRPRGRQPHRHAPAPDDLRVGRAAGHAPRRRPRVRRGRARADRPALPRGDRPHDGAALARALRRAQRRRSGAGPRSRATGTSAGRAAAPGSTASTGSRTRARAPTSRPTGCSRAWSSTPRTAASSCSTSAATAKNRSRRRSRSSSTA